MDRKKQITPITDADFEAVINNSVMGAGSRLVGSAQEQKALFVKPIADKSGSSAMSYIKQLVEQLVEVIAEGDVAVDELTSAVGEATEEIKKKLTKTTTPNRIYGTDAHGRYKLYELNEVGDIIGGEGEIGDIFQFVQELPEEGMKNVLYFVLKTDGEGNDLFDEWVWANKGTDEEPIYYWEYIGTKKIAIDTSLFVKFTDYATYAKAGVVKLLSSGDAYSGIAITANGELVLSGSTSALSDAFFNNPQHYSVPVLAKNLYRWMKVGLSKNTETWTDEDKAKACETIGAIAKMKGTPDSGATRGFIYGLAYDGETPALYPIQIQAGGETIVYRNQNGNFYVSTPTRPYECVNKKYVDDIATTNEAWTFVLEDGSTVVKRVALKEETE